MDTMVKKFSKTTLIYDDGSDSYSTELPEPDADCSILSIVLISLAIVFTIGVLFGLAVFIDCRHQNLDKNRKRDPERGLFNIHMPKFFKFGRFSNEDEDFVDKIYGDGNVIA